MKNNPLPARFAVVTIQLLSPGGILVIRNNDHGVETLPAFINYRPSLAA